MSDVTDGDLWLFPPGMPHSIQGLGPDGCQFLLVFDDGNFNEFETFLLTDWLTHTPKEVLAKNFGVNEATFDNVPKKELFIFQTELPEDLKKEQAYVAQGTGTVPLRMDFKPSEMKATKVTAGGEVKIIDAKNFPITTISAAIVKLKPGGLRELHWHPNADEWQYYVSGKGRMTMFRGRRARANDGRAGGRCRLRSSVESALCREHRRYRTGVSGDVQDAALPGHFAGGMAGAHAGAARRAASSASGKKC